MKTLQMQSCVHENGTVECALVEIDVVNPRITRCSYRSKRRQSILRTWGLCSVQRTYLAHARLSVMASPHCYLMSPRCHAGDGAAHRPLDAGW